MISFPERVGWVFCSVKSENISMSLSQCFTSVCEFRSGKVIVRFSVIIGHLIYFEWLCWRFIPQTLSDVIRSETFTLLQVSHPQFTFPFYLKWFKFELSGASVHCVGLDTVGAWWRTIKKTSAPSSWRSKQRLQLSWDGIDLCFKYTRPSQLIIQISEPQWKSTGQLWETVMSLTFGVTSCSYVKDSFTKRPNGTQSIPSRYYRSIDW